MSYTRTYTTSVHYSGSESYSYPASEHGGSGTVHYSGDVPVNINIAVNTDPFDTSVNGTKTTLTLVAGAVAALEAAQVAEVARAADEISQTAVHGFYQLISSDLSGRASESSSGMRSSAGLLAQEAQRVDDVHSQMKSDYQAIKSRYVRIFSRLDAELDRRIRELDRPAFDLAKRAVRDVVQRPYESSAARAVVQAEDTGAAQLKLQCARAKRRASESLENLGEVCGYITECQHAMERVMDETSGEDIMFVPVIVATQRNVGTMQMETVAYGPDVARHTSMEDDVRRRVGQAERDQRLTASGTDRREVDRDFYRLLSEYGAQGGRDRVSQLIASMYSQANEEQGM